MRAPKCFGAIALASFCCMAAKEQTEKKKQETPALIQALSAGEFTKAKELIAKGADPNSKDSQGGTALMWAAERGQAELVETLIAKGSRVNEKDPAGSTALMNAVSNGNVAIARILLSHGAPWRRPTGIRDKGRPQPHYRGGIRRQNRDRSASAG